MGKLNDALTAIDAIVTDVNTNVTLPDHATWKYAAHPAIQPKLCPLLTVSLDVTRWELIATPATYALYPSVLVGWYVSAVDEMDQAGAGLDALSHDIAQKADAISSRLESYAVGIPTMSNVWGAIADTTPVREPLVAGFVHRLVLERM